MSPPDSPVPPQLKPIIALPIFRGLSEKDALGLLEIAESLELPEQKVLFEEGEPGDALYIVVSGHLEVLKKDRSGRQQLLARVGDGSVIGEMSLLGSQTARSATARAETRSQLLRIPAGRFQRLVHTDSLPALRVVHNLAQVMSRRLLMMDEKLVGLMDSARKREELSEFQRILSDWSF